MTIPLVIVLLNYNGVGTDRAGVFGLSFISSMPGMNITHQQKYRCYNEYQANTRKAKMVKAKTLRSREYDPRRLK